MAVLAAPISNAVRVRLANSLSKVPLLPVWMRVLILLNPITRMDQCASLVMLFVQHAEGPKVTTAALVTQAMNT